MSDDISLQGFFLLARRLAMIAAVFLLLLLMSVGVLVGTLQTEAGREWLTGRLSTVMSSGPGRRVTLEGLGGTLPWDIRLERLSVADAEGCWLLLEGISVQWSPLELLHGMLAVQEVHIRSLHLERTPLSEGGESSSEGSRLPEITFEAPPVTVDRLACPRISMGASVLAQAAVLEAVGFMDPGQSRAPGEIALWLKRVDDGPSLWMSLWGRLGTETPTLKLDLEVLEASGGMLSTLLGQKSRGELKLHLSGDGPSSNWKGRLEASATEWGALAAAFAVSLQEEALIEWSGVVSLADPPAFVGLPASVASDLQFEFLARFPDTDTVSLERLDVAGTGWSVSAHGRFGLEPQAVESMILVRVQDVRSLGFEAGSSWGGNGDLCAAFSGSLSSLRAAVDLDLEETTGGGLQIARLAAQLQLDPLEATATGKAGGWRVAGAGDISGLRAVSGEALPETNLRWSLKAEVPLAGEAALEELRLHGAHHEVEMRGRVDPATLVGTLEASLRADDLKPVSRYFGREVPGRLSLAVNLAGNGHTRSGTGAIRAELLPDLESPDEITGLVGEAMTFSASVEAQQGQVLHLPEARIESRALKAVAKGRFDLNQHAFEAEVLTSIQDLKAFSPVVKQELSGRAESALKASGLLGDFSISHRLEGRDIRWGQQKPAQVRSTLEALHLPRRTEGTLKLEVSESNETMSASTGFAVSQDQLQLRSLVMNGIGCRLDGKLALDLKTRSTTGSLRGQFQDLSRMGRFVGYPLQGNGVLDAELTTAGGTQSLALKLSGNDLGAGPARISALSIRADVKDLFQNLSGGLQAELSGLRSGAADIRSAWLRADGSRSRLAFSGRASGSVPQNLDLQLAGSLVSENEAWRIEMTDLKGTFGPYPFGISDRLLMLHSPREVSLDRLSLNLGEAHVRANGRVAADRVQGRLSFDHLPLQLAAVLGGPDVTGTAQGQLEIQGTPSRPEASAELRLHQFRLRQAKGENLPTGSLHARARLNAGRLQGEWELTEIFPKPARGDFAIPLQVSFAPGPQVLFPPRDPLEAHAELEGNLGRLVGFLPLPNQSISGNARVALDVTGTLAQPSFSGELQVTDGFYENLESGTVLKQLSFEATARERRLEILRFQGTDGEKGTVGLTGWMALDEGNHFSMDCEAVFREAKLLRRSELDATTDGKLRITGASKGFQVAGELSIVTAEYRIPDRLPAGTAELTVIELNKPGPSKQLQPSSPHSTPQLPLTLNISLDFPNRTFVRGRGLNSEWRGQLTINGEALKPVLKGNLEIVRGYFDFLDRRFDIQKGAISFFGSTPPVPMLDFTAKAKAKEIAALVKVTGSASAPEIQLTSDPPLPQEEVMARLLFGRSADRITPLQALKLAQAVRSLSGSSGLPGLDFLGATRRLLGLDQLELRNTEGKSETGLGLGKYLTEDIYVDVEKELSGKGGKISVEVELTPNLSLESEVGSDAQTGVGLNWKYDY